MGNNPSSTAKSPGTPTSPASGNDSHRAKESSRQGSHHHSHPSHHHSSHDHSGYNPVNAITPSTASHEASLAQAQGSTVVSRPKSLPATAVSSLSASPLGSVPSSAKPTESRPSTSAQDEPSKPVDVPVESTSLRSHQTSHAHEHGYDPELETQAGAHLVSNSSITDMYLTRPPRLPLPIEEEVHTPGSPILSPDETQPDVEVNESTDALTRKSSTLSATTVDEDDAEELRVDKTRPVVATKLEWKRGGDKVYVTGTIFQWNRKQRLHPVEGKTGYFAGTIYVLPGTHHVRFLVDGIMQTSPDLPTTVDFGNNLVNYIEVSPDQVQQQAQSPAAAKAADAGLDTQASRSSSAAKEQPKPPKGKAAPPLSSYQSEIPQYLVDFDQAEDSPAYQNAVGAIEKLSTPPTLPGFLGKPILNAATLMKDDNSVLNMPNHTVLNHLATSSIKNSTLAVSATTRYKNKYVTTIVYKPTSIEG